jgi:phosphate transport system protein
LAKSINKKEKIMLRQHIVKSFDKDLQTLRDKITEMAECTETQITRALDALISRDSEVAEDVINNDVTVNKLQQEIDDLTVRMLATRQPLGFDLRNVISGLKIATDLERIADNAKRIARSVDELNSITLDKPIKLLIEMSRIGQQMLIDIIDSYKKADAEKAIEIWQLDKKIDKVYADFLTQFQGLVKENSAHIHVYTTLIFVARCCERIGDHVTNIAEDIYYIVNGKYYQGG